MASIATCIDCNERFTSTAPFPLRCATCAQKANGILTRRTKKMEAAGSSGNSNSEDSTPIHKIPEQVIGVGGGDLAKLLSAQNRTTHAIRSIAVFFFINIFTSIFGGFWILVAMRDLQTCDYSCGPANVMFNIGASIVGVGFLVAMIAGLRELSKSKA